MTTPVTVLDGSVVVGLEPKRLIERHAVRQAIPCREAYAERRSEREDSLGSRRLTEERWLLRLDSTTFPPSGARWDVNSTSMREPRPSEAREWLLRLDSNQQPSG
jgi:hypothetical protein